MHSRLASLLLLDGVVSEGQDLLQHLVGRLLRAEGPEGFDDVLDDLVEGPEALADHHGHVDVLEVEHGHGHVGAEDADQQDDVTGDVLEHEDDPGHLQHQQQQLHHHPVQRLALDLVVVLLLQLELAVQLRHRVQNLREVGALEDAKEDGDDGVADDAALQFKLEMSKKTDGCGNKNTVRRCEIGTLVLKDHNQRAVWYA